MSPLLLLPWIGLPLDRAAAIGAVPSLSRVAEDVRFALPGGFATLVVAGSEREAELAFEGLERTAVTHWPPTAAGLPGERAIGDGEGLVLLRDRNAVLLVRDRDGHAADLAKQLLASLTTDAAVCAPVSHEAPGDAGAAVRWDACGRRL
jgi:hypothetical protein